MIRDQDIFISAEMLNLIAEIDEFKGAWRALGVIAPERLRSLRRIATIESIGSSTRIEGSSLSDAEVERLLGALEIRAFATRDEEEVAGYAETVETILTAWEDIPLSESHIRQLHRDLLKYSSKDERHRGDYKTLPNHVGAFDESGQMVGIVFQTASPFETPGQMAELVRWYNEAVELRRLHPLLAIGLFVVVFLAIHPFQDGNGRLSRLLTTLLLLKAGYAYAPYSSLENVIEQSKERYYLALRQTQSTLAGEAVKWEPWLLYFLRALQQQKQRLERRVEKEKLMEPALPELSLQILGQAREHGRVTLGEMARISGVSRNTLKGHFRKLAAAGLLRQHGGGRSTWYALGERGD